MKTLKWIVTIIVLVMAVFVIWKREPWVKTFADKQSCENSTSRSCVNWQCDYIQTTFWLDCPHGGSFFAPVK